MFTESEYERAYTGSMINVQYIQTLLLDEGITSITRDDMKSGMMAGFGGGIPDHIQVFVKKEHYDKARTLIETNIA